MTEAPERIIPTDSGAQSHLGYEVHLFADRAEAIMEIDERHRNRNGTLHGGLFALLLDAACGYSASRVLSEDGSHMVVTVSLTTNYLSPGNGNLVRAVGRITKAGKTMLFANGEVFDENDTLLATATGVFKAVRPR